MTPKSLTTIRIRLNKDIDEDGLDNPHHEIGLGMGLELAADDEAEWQRYGAPEDAAVREALTYVSGVFGRVVALAYDWLEGEARAHGCRDRFVFRGELCAVVDYDDPSVEDVDRVGRSCHMSPWDLVRTPEGFQTYPNLCLYVPANRSKVWIARVQQWLAEIDATDEGRET
jgi:hypothetical protein